MGRGWLRRYVAFLVTLVALLSASRAARALEPVVVTADVGEIPLGRHVEYLEDREGKLTLDDVRSPAMRARWTPSDSDAPNFGFSTAAHWFHLALRNDGTQPIDALFEVALSELNHVTIFEEREPGHFVETAVGSHLPFAARPIPTETYVVPVHTLPGTHDVYIDVRTDTAVQLPLTLWSPSRFARAEHAQAVEHGLFFGAMLVMLAYNLFLYFSVRDRSYLYYAAYVASFVYMQASLDGLTFEYLVPSSPWLEERFRLASFGSTCVGVALFNRSFLDLPRLLPGWNRVMLGIVAIGTVIILGAPWESLRVGGVLVSGLSLAGAPVGVITGLQAWRRGQRSARYYVVGWTAFFSAAVVFVAGKLGFLPWSGLAAHGMKMGSLVEVVLLSFALADRMNQLKADKEEAQAHALVLERTAKETLQREVARQTQELRDQAAKLVELDKQKTHFFQNVSHELRTPLTLILNPLDEMSREVVFSREPRIDVAIKNARRLLRLVNQLLDFQKLAAGKKEWHLSPIDAAAFARSCGEYFAPACKAQGVSFAVEAPAEPVVVSVEADALEKIVFNFLANALKYTPKGKAITLSIASDGGHARLAVRDEGPGISEEGQKRLFQLFSQVDAHKGLSLANEGTGLGLALAKELAEAMHGSVGVESKEGEGSTFWVSLPVVHAEAQDAKATGKAMADVPPARKSERISVRAPASTASVDPSGARVLVVDDLADMRDLVGRTLARHGYGVTLAAGGPEALAALRDAKADLVVTDWMMPGMSGPELVAAIRADEGLRAVPVVLLTAKSDEESKLAGTEIGADAFLGKPFNESELVSTVRNLVQLKEREREVERLNRHIAENVLKRYLPADLVDDILAGRTSVDVEPETVQATILFADLAGFTRTSAKLRAAKMARLLNEYLTKMNDVVFAHGGTIDKYMGDGIMVIFGAPVRLEAKDQVRRAAACAIAMQHAMTDLNARWVAEGLPEIKLRIGLHHGPVVVGNFGDARRSDYTAIGPTVNLASRIEGACPEGGVLASGEVYDFLPEQMAEDAGAFELKGVEGVVRCFKLVLGTPSQASFAIH